MIVELNGYENECVMKTGGLKISSEMLRLVGEKGEFKLGAGADDDGAERLVMLKRVATIKSIVSSILIEGPWNSF